MGLTDWIRKPNLSMTPPTVYHATIQTGRYRHVFVFYVIMRGIREPEVFLVLNDVGFHMPEGATFEVTKTANTEVNGHKAAVKFLKPTDEADTTDEDTYTPPDELLGRYIPEIEHREGEMVPLEEIN